MTPVHHSWRLGFGATFSGQCTSRELKKNGIVLSEAFVGHLRKMRSIDRDGAGEGTHESRKHGARSQGTREQAHQEATALRKPFLQLL